MSRLVEGLGAASAALLLAMMLLTVGDVGGRGLLAAPIPGAFELTELAMAGLVFLGLPAATWRGQHVEVDILRRALPPGLARTLRRAGGLLAAAVLALIAWRLAEKGVQLRAFGERTAFLGLGVWPVALAMSALAGLAALAGLVRALGPRA